MRQFTVFITLTSLTLTCFGQDKKDLAVSFSTGILNSPYYYKAYAGSFFGFGFDYHISKRHILSASYLAGKHDYYDNILSNTTNFIILPKGTNAKARYNTFAIAYKYKILINEKFNFTPGVGAGIMTHSRNYPYMQGTSLVFNTSSWSDLVFPVTLDINYKILKRWQLGVTGGFLIHPDYPILALHVGPKLSYVLK